MGLFAHFLVLALTTTPLFAQESISGWQQLYKDDFDEGGETAHWQSISGQWRAEGGKLVGQGQVLLIQPISGSQRVVMRARSDSPGDLSILLGVNEDGYKSGYFMGFGSDGNQQSKLLVRGKPVEIAEATISPGRWHDIECYRDGQTLLLRVDGEEVIRYVDAQPLAGESHNQIGLYFYNPGQVDHISVWSKPDEFDSGTQAQQVTEHDRPAQGNLVDNGNFEFAKPGTRTLPDRWSVRLGDRDDRIELVYDHRQAHTGRGVVRITNNSGPGITLDAIPEDGVMLVPGETYRVRFWAKSVSGTSPEIILEPGAGRFSPTTDWHVYETLYTHPADAAEQLGCFVRVMGGRVLIDDISFTHVDETISWPAEQLADRTPLELADHHTDWHLVGGRDHLWGRRTVIQISEVMGRPAQGATVKLKLSDALPGIRYDKVSTETVRVIDAQTSKAVTFKLVESDSYTGPSAMDELIMKIDCPAHHTSVFYVYYAQDAYNPASAWDAKIPLSLARPSRYRHSLDTEIVAVQRPITVRARENEAGLDIDVTSYLPGQPVVSLHAPEDGQTVQVPLTQQDGSTSVWQAHGFMLPEGAVDGLWRLEAQVKEIGESDLGVCHLPVVIGSAMWWATNADSPQAEPTVSVADPYWVQLSAARNEKESFQLILASNEPMNGTRIISTDLVHEDGKSTIPAERVDFKWVETVYVAMPYPHGLTGGAYYDPLVPWRKRDVVPGISANAWVTVDVPVNAEPGEYWGDVVATSEDGRELVLPVRLRVFGFLMPDDPTMKAVLGGDIWERVTKGYHPRPDGKNPYHDIHDGEATLALAELLADRHATPFYYHHDKSPYAVPWHYDPQTGEAEFDFRQLDRNVPKMLDWGQDYLFFGGKFAAGWRNTGRVFDWSRDLERARQAYWEEAYPDHLFNRDTPEGMRMHAAYCRGIADHLESKGWIDKAVIYVTDEDKNDAVREVAGRVTDQVHSVNPKLKTLVLSNAEHRYAEYMDKIDLFGGRISPEHLERYKESGGVWLGSYNSGGFMTTPLAYTRSLGARNWLDGSVGYVNWAIWRNPDALIDSSYHSYVGPNAGYPQKTFVSHTDPSFSSYGTWVYPWPAWEPLPAGPEQSLFVSSVRLEALREAVEDYEYFEMIKRIADKQRPDAHGSTPAGTLLLKLGELVDASHTRIHKFDYYNISPTEYQTLRERCGEMIDGSTPE